MSSSAVVILSHARADVMLRGFTAEHMRYASRPVYLAVREDELAAYEPVYDKYPYLRPMPLPLPCVGKGACRDAALRHQHLFGVEKVLLCDDDLVFSYRDSGELPILPDECINAALDAVFSEITETTPHVGLCLRRSATSAHTNTRTKRVDEAKFGKPCAPVDEYKEISLLHGVHRRVCVDNGIAFAWAHPFFVDAHFQLNVIRAGYRTVVVNGYIVAAGVGPGKDNTKTSLAMRTTAAYALQGQFPEAVRLCKRQTPDGEYTDVQVDFGKARPSELAGVRR